MSTTTTRTRTGVNSLMIEFDDDDDDDFIFALKPVSLKKKHFTKLTHFFLTFNLKRLINLEVTWPKMRENHTCEDLHKFWHASLVIVSRQKNC